MMDAEERMVGLMFAEVGWEVHGCEMVVKGRKV